MPGEDIQSWSVTAANNSNADTSINWQEGQPRASVNNSARSVMAAHAKDRNLKNGSIVTGGTANALTFTSGITYTTVPTGLWVRLKLGATNTGSATLSMDSIDPVAIKTETGQDLVGGELIIGRYAEFIYDGTNWILLWSQGTGGIVPNHGRLAFVSATLLSFKPLNSNLIRINGVLYQIPAAGIAGLANTGVNVNGTDGAALVANTAYYVYASIVGGIVTASFWNVGHETSSTIGNEGVEIKIGSDTHTLIGMIKMNGTQFADDPIHRGVLSWFNRRNKSVLYQLGNTATVSSTFAILSSPLAVMNWADEAVNMQVFGQVDNTAGTFGGVAVYIDGATLFGAYNFCTGTIPQPLTAGGWADAAEGHHDYYLAAQAGGGQTNIANPFLTGMTRG